MKLLVVGWDAATERHLDRFDLPFWDSLDHSGRLLPENPFHGTYISSGNAWTTITTGAGFKEHRIFGLVHGPYTGHRLSGPVEFLLGQQWLPHATRRILLGFVYGNLVTDGGRGATPQSTDVRYKRVWEYLPGEALVFGLPITYPVWDTNGVLVAGIPAPDPGAASHPLVYPPEIEGEVFDEAFSGYHVGMTSPIHDPDASEEAFCRAHVEQTRVIAEKYLDLYRNRSPDEGFEFGFLMLRSIDDVLHATTEEELIERIYRTTDDVTQEIVDEIDPDAVLVLSDHGMRPTSPLRIEKDIRMDHDTTQGVWGGTEPFDLTRQIDVTEAVLNHYEVDASVPEERGEYDVVESRVDQPAVKNQLEDLGYL